MAEQVRQRLDKWLWFARIVKTRSLASGLVEAGHVRLNRNKVNKPGHLVGPGDVLTIVLNTRVRVLHVTGLAARRGPANSARQLYREPDIQENHGIPPQKMDASNGRTC